MRSLASSLILRGKIKTTEAKAKELRPMVEKLVTKGKNATMASRRLVSSNLGDSKEAEIKKLFEEIGPRYKDRKGGYTRIIKLPRRLADGSPMAIIEFV